MMDSDHGDERSEYVEPPHPDEPTTAKVDDDEDEDPGWPWSFILLVAAGALYLIFRFADLIINLFN